MIVRIFRAQIQPDKLAEWQDKVEKFSIPWLKSQRGMLEYYPGKPYRKIINHPSLVARKRNAD